MNNNNGLSTQDVHGAMACWRNTFPSNHSHINPLSSQFSEVFMNLELPLDTMKRSAVSKTVRRISQKPT